MPLKPAKPATLHARDVMTRDTITAEPSMDIRELARLFTANDISGVPVVDPGDRVLGVVSKTDVIQRALEGAPGSRGARGDFSFLDVLDDDLGDMLPADLGVVQDIMTADPVTCRPDDALGAVARRMAEESVHRIIVVDEHGRLVGVITSMDVLHAFPE
jgi:CBS-domain-containing membrane protein